MSLETNSTINIERHDATQTVVQDATLGELNFISSNSVVCRNELLALTRTSTETIDFEVVLFDGVNSFSLLSRTNWKGTTFAITDRFLIPLGFSLRATTTGASTGTITVTHTRLLVD